MFRLRFLYNGSVDVERVDSFGKVDSSASFSVLPISDLEIGVQLQMAFLPIATSSVSYRRTPQTEGVAYLKNGLT